MVFYYDGPGTLTQLLGFWKIMPVMLKAVNCICIRNTTHLCQAAFVTVEFLVIPHIVQVSALHIILSCLGIYLTTFLLFYYKLSFCVLPLMVD